jgi:hypothetical protein
MSLLACLNLNANFTEVSVMCTSCIAISIQKSFSTSVYSYPLDCHISVTEAFVVRYSGAFFQKLLSHNLLSISLFYFTFNERINQLVLTIPSLF